MKPRDLTQANWDVNVAVFETSYFDARVTADGKNMWFRVSLQRCFADVTIPIKEFRRAVDFVSAFDMRTLTDDHPCDGTKLGSHCVEILNRVGVLKNGKRVMSRYPGTVHFMSLRKNHGISIRLSEFRKLIRWYNTDV